jgi:hypothetical protein
MLNILERLISALVREEVVRQTRSSVGSSETEVNELTVTA